ncbi:MAG: phosphoribosylformylglycinamidine cyclo-ligase [Verrucomicrobia bacterium]|nr:phosphoribosylformylglycinamidine cyclo-ligase [Verrucomicrobiota bacterium]MBV9274572.1 phosphoribosylformylglycinamidine cyclo-ligase [Verrucomicrobiota bacterium]
MKTAVKKKAYAAAGVDVALGNQVKSGLQEKLKRTFGPEVLGRIGGFGGLFRAEFGDMKEPVLVSSIDGVGTKLKVAIALNSHESVAQDLVNHCINDIAVIGARPLFFLDYIGAERLNPNVFDQLISGFTKACKAGNCALIGGETAQLPDLYHHGEYDLAGCIVGVVDRPKIFDGSRIVASDLLLGLPSNGLHTNGFSLARKVLLQQMRLEFSQKPEGLSRPLGEELLRIHKNYQPLLTTVPASRIKGAAHITGGGLVDNIPRILPAICDALIDTNSWKVPSIFRLIQRGGRISTEEMYEVFNMGIGMVLVVARHHAEEVATKAGAKVIGQVTPGSGRVLLS